ncbi:hypothetical protein C8R45DRAFT_927088 [Mycena sanguinolenta]|nr:hypothetical protein C8R45DRAFT_927088 [Mycena sanguinolenta]
MLRESTEVGEYPHPRCRYEYLEMQTSQPLEIQVVQQSEMGGISSGCLAVRSKPAPRRARVPRTGVLNRRERRQDKMNRDASVNTETRSPDRYLEPSDAPRSIESENAASTSQIGEREGRNGRTRARDKGFEPMEKFKESRMISLKNSRSADGSRGWCRGAIACTVCTVWTTIAGIQGRADGFGIAVMLGRERDRECVRGELLLVGEAGRVPGFENENKYPVFENKLSGSCRGVQAAWVRARAYTSHATPMPGGLERNEQQELEKQQWGRKALATRRHAGHVRLRAADCGNVRGAPAERRVVAKAHDMYRECKSAKKGGATYESIEGAGAWVPDILGCYLTATQATVLIRRRRCTLEV